MKKQLAKFAQAAVLGLAITFTFNACEEKEKKQDGTTATETAATQQPTQEAAAPPSTGTFTDTRDNKTYKTIKIGNLTWMAENLNFEAKGSKCYDNKPANCATYGKLYNWETAMKSCPSGWRLPSNDEWKTLVDLADGELKSKSGFSALPGGGYSYGSFQSIGSNGNWWSSSEDGSEAISRTMIDDSFGNDLSAKSYLFSVRCVQEANATAPAEKASGSTLTDTRDSKTYKTVKIGSQTWMAENLNFEAKGSKCNGELERVYDEASEDYIYKPSKDSPDKIQANCQKYGRLYDWKTAKTACPSGWKLPSNAEWEKLLHYVDGTSDTESPYHSETAGKYLKAKSGWIDDFRGQSGEVNGIDKYDFSALPGGSIGASNGNYETVGQYGLWWSSSDAKDKGMSDYAYYRIMYYHDEGVLYSDTDNSGLLSVRCIQN